MVHAIGFYGFIRCWQNEVFGGNGNVDSGSMCVAKTGTFGEWLRIRILFGWHHTQTWYDERFW